MMYICRKDTKKVQELWWQGLPPGIRGQVWIRAIGNELNLSKGVDVDVGPILWYICMGCVHALELYEISLRRCNSKLSDDSRPRSGCELYLFGNW